MSSAAPNSCALEQTSPNIAMHFLSIPLDSITALAFETVFEPPTSIISRTLSPPTSRIGNSYAHTSAAPFKLIASSIVLFVYISITIV